MASSPEPTERTFRSVGEFCKAMFPKAHAARTCGCFPKPRQGILVILPRPGVK